MWNDWIIRWMFQSKAFAAAASNPLCIQFLWPPWYLQELLQRSVAPRISSWANGPAQLLCIGMHVDGLFDNWILSECDPRVQRKCCKRGLPFLNPLNCLSMLASTSEMTSGHLDLFLHLTPKKQLGKQFKAILTTKIYQDLPQAQSRSYLRLATWLLIQRLTSKVPSVTAIAAVWSSSPTLLGDPACEREQPLGFADSRPYSSIFCMLLHFKSQISLHVLCCACRRMIQVIQKRSKTAKQLFNTISLWHCNYKRNKWTKRRSASPSWILWTAWVCWPAPARWPVAISTCFFTWLQRNSLGSSSRRFWLPRSTKYIQVHPNQCNQRSVHCTCPTTSDLQHDCWFSVWPPKCLLSLPSQQFDRHLPLFWATLPVKGNNPLDLLTVGHTQASFACFYTLRVKSLCMCCAVRVEEWSKQFKSDQTQPSS